MNIDGIDSVEARLLDFNVYQGSLVSSQNILTALPGTFNNDTGNYTELIDLSSFSGSPIRISFVTTIPEYFTGPGHIQIDNVQMVPEPTTLGLIGLCALMIRRKK